MRLIQSKLEWLVNPDGSLGHEIRLWEREGKYPSLAKIPSKHKVLILDTEERKFSDLPEVGRTWLFEQCTKMAEVEFFLLTDTPIQFIGKILPKNLWLGFLMHRQKDVPRLTLLTRQEVKTFVVIDPMEEGINMRYGVIKWIIIGAANPSSLTKPQAENFIDDVKRYNVALYVRPSIAFRDDYPKDVPGVGRLERHR